MKKSVISVGIVTLAAILCAPLGYAEDAPGIEVAIQVSPSTLVLDGPGNCVTVHADIKFGDVDTSVAVKLNGVDAYDVFPDNRGDLVAKFDQAAIEDVVDVPSAVLTLEGTTETGDPFQGGATVTVKEFGQK